MFDKQNPPKPPSPKRSFVPKLLFGVVLVLGIKYLVDDPQEKKQVDAAKTNGRGESANHETSFDAR